MRVLISLRTAVNGKLGYGKWRDNTYKIGMNKFVSFLDEINDIGDICLFDNTVTNKENLPFDLPSKILTELFICNNNGLYDKGAGLIEGWKYCESVLCNYDWIIHFEPRTELINCDFFHSFNDNPRNLFVRIPWNDKKIWTGLFAISVDDLFDFINETDENLIKSGKTTIEKSLFHFMKNKNFDYEEKANVIWRRSRKTGDIKV